MARRRQDLDSRLERFARAVEAAAGENLLSLVLYGSAAQGTAGERSDLNLLMVLQDASAAALRPLGGPVREWVRTGERPPLIFSEVSWRASADVFPIEIEDIRAHHRVLRGRDPVEDLTTTRDDQRRELEREARGKLVQLRAAYAAAEADGKALAELIVTSARTFLVLFRAGVRIARQPVPTDRRALVGAVAELAGIDAAAFDWPLEQLDAPRKPKLAAYDPRAARYFDAVAAFVDYVDRA